MPESKSPYVDLTRTFDTAAEHSLALPAPTVEPLADVGRDEVNVDLLTTPTHCGTHVDAPRHVLAEGPTIDEVPLSRLTGEGVVLPVEGDVVLFSFGWERFTGTEAYHEYPWLAGDLLEWLLAREVTLVGVDTLSPDQPRSLRESTVEDPYPVHRALLRAGIPIVENIADPSRFAGERIEVVCAPLKLRGSDGAPARVLVRTLD
jgi:kynurenine formamidase